MIEYQVLEGDAPAIPPDMLNEQGKEGWELCGIAERITKPPLEPEGQKRWVFYFKRQKKEA